ncbi:MAG TPA: DUF3617 family protein [Candidatus Angelobacter sp.]|nr:DUF3617 family protein [Candidatus Angelobacter sp.]
MREARIILTGKLLATTWMAVPFFAAAAAAIGLQPGEFLFTITYQIQGAGKGTSSTNSRCIAAADLDNPEKVFNDRVFADFKADESCTVRDFKSSGGKISYDADCSNRVAHVEGRLTSTEFWVIRDVTPKASRGVSLKLTLTGKRTGECTK